MERCQGVPLDSGVGARLERAEFWTQHPGTPPLLWARTVEQIGGKRENSMNYLELNEITYVKCIADIL